MQSSMSVPDPSSKLFLHMHISDSNLQAHFGRTYIESVCESIAKSNKLSLNSVMVASSPILRLLPECKTAVPPTIQETSRSRPRGLDWPFRVAKVRCKVTDSHSATASSCSTLDLIPLCCGRFSPQLWRPFCTLVSIVAAMSRLISRSGQVLSIINSSVHAAQFLLTRRLESLVRRMRVDT